MFTRMEYETERMLARKWEGTQDSIRKMLFFGHSWTEMPSSMKSPPSIRRFNQSKSREVTSQNKTSPNMIFAMLLIISNASFFEILVRSLQITTGRPDEIMKTLWNRWGSKQMDLWVCWGFTHLWISWGSNWNENKHLGQLVLKSLLSILIPFIFDLWKKRFGWVRCR